MDYLVHLLDHDAILDEIREGDGWLESWAFHLPSENARLGELDPSGETLFNRIQSLRLLEEVAALLTLPLSNPQQAFLLRLSEMLERCRDSDDLMVRFRGR